MKRLTERELKEAKDYDELKWYQGMPVIVAAFGETWKRLADTHDTQMPTTLSSWTKTTGNRSSEHIPTTNP